MIEQQQVSITIGLRQMYRSLLQHDLWEGLRLEEVDGNPLTHDILDVLGALHPSDSESLVRFEDDLDELQSRMFKENEDATQQPCKVTSSSRASSLSHKFLRSESTTPSHAFNVIPKSPEQRLSETLSRDNSLSIPGGEEFQLVDSYEPMIEPISTSSSEQFDLAYYDRTLDSGSPVGNQSWNMYMKQDSTSSSKGNSEMAMMASVLASPLNYQLFESTHQSPLQDDLDLFISKHIASNAGLLYG
jgi:hypothetical protein